MYASDVKHASPSLEEKLSRLYSLHGGKPVDLTFCRPPYMDLLAAFGNPHLHLPPVIHVAGTNGKGSTIATLKSILQAEGYKTHVYTSPHLCAFNERIVLANNKIDDNTLENLIDEALKLNGTNTITFFEIITAMAFAAFSRTPADILLLETGLGGRVDCTNVIENPLCTIITSIGYDHMEFLGEHIEQIAAEKAGIMKPDSPCIIGPQTLAEKVMPVFTETASSKGSPLVRHGSDWSIEDKGAAFNFVYKDVEMTLPHPNLQGLHQIVNAGTALATLKTIEHQLPVSEQSIKHGLQNIQWPGRLDNITSCFKNVPADWEIWLDGGHNSDGAGALSAQARKWKNQDDKPLHLVLGMMNRKSPIDFIKELQSDISTVTAIPVGDEPQSFDSNKSHDLLQSSFSKLNVSKSENFESAIKNLLAYQKQPGRILIAGSLYLAGHVLKSIGKEP